MIKKLFMKKYLEAGVFIGFFIILIACIQSSSAEEITLNFVFPEPEINQVNISNNVSDYITMQNLTNIGNPNLPLIPIKPLKILLPQKGVLESINVTYNGNISMGDEYNVVTVNYPFNNFTSMDHNCSNETYYTSYNSSIPYPTNSYSIIGIYDFRGYSILVFNLYPVFYIKDTGEIYYYENMTVTITTNESGSVNSLFTGLESDKMYMRTLVDDFSMDNTYISYANHSHSSIVNPEDHFDYVIITRDDFINAAPNPLDAHEWHTFQELADYKNDTGVITNIVTVNEIINNPYYRGYSESSLDDCDDTQSRIRNFIKDAKENWGITYVLLGGDDDIIPARLLWYTSGTLLAPYINSCPSDLYYSCLDGPFNGVDDDGFWGKPNDGIDGNDVDLCADVYVGRACVSNTREVSNFVSKTLTYEMSDNHEDYIENVLLVGEILDIKMSGEDIIENPDNWGSVRKDIVVGHQDEAYGYIVPGIPDEDYDIVKLYDENYWESNPNETWDPSVDGWKKQQIRYTINNGKHSIVNSNGHGFTNKAMKLKEVDTLTFCNDKPFFLYSSACFSGAFDNKIPQWVPLFGNILFPWRDCFAEYLTVKTRHSAFAAIMNSRYGWYESNENFFYKGGDVVFDRGFFNAIYNQGRTALGEALAVSKFNNIFYLDLENGFSDSKAHQYRDIYYESNLFGDPQLSFKEPVANDPPNKPDITEGVADPYHKLHWTYTVVATDPEDDSIYYNWQWDRLENSIWEGPYDSGEEATKDHWWWTLGPYLNGIHYVCVTARDQYGNIQGQPGYWEGAVSFDCDMDMSSNPVVVNHEVEFYGQAECVDVEQWVWNFGQGRGKQYTQNATQTYSAPGEYTVNLTVTNDLNITSNITRTVNVVLLKSDFFCSSIYSTPNQIISFNDTSGGYYTIGNWTWEFDENDTTYNQNTSREYTTEGTYEVSLTVRDAYSNTNTSTKTIYIDTTPPKITTILDNPQTVGCGSNISINVNLTDSVSGIKTAKINITYPDNETSNFSMSYSDNNIYGYTFNETWELGDYEYTIWTVDNANNSNISTSNSFSVTRYFGKNIVGSLNQSILDTITGTIFTTHEKGIADNISVYIDPGNATADAHYRCMIYRHNDSTLMGITEQKNVSSGKGWRTFNFSAPKPALLNNTEYVIACWSNNSTVKMCYSNANGDENITDNGTSLLNGHYFEGMYNYTPESINFDHENRDYSITCRYTPDNTLPEIANVSASPNVVGFGYNVTITAEITDNISGVNIVKIILTSPDNTTSNFTMNNANRSIYTYMFTNSWRTGQYNYTVWAEDNTINTNSSTGYCFNVSVDATISIATLQNSYSSDDYINITDPPNPSENLTLVSRGLTWNEYYNLTSGSNVLEVSTGPINYQTDNGSWTPINTSFNTLTSNHPAYNYGYRIGNDRGLYGVYFKPNAQNDWPIAFTYNRSDDLTTNVIRSKLLGVGYVDPASNWAYKYLQNVQSSQGQSNSNSITYSDVFTGTDVTWSYGNTGLKEEITLSNVTKTVLQNHPPSQYGLNNASSYLVFITKLDHQNLDMYNASGMLNGNVTISDAGVDFKDALGQFKCALPLGEAYELNNESARQKLTYRIIHLNDNIYLLSGLKVSDLNAMTFPVVIDPTLTVYSTTSDGYIYNSGTNYNTVRTASSGTISSSGTYITIGQNKASGFPGTYQVYRGFVFFNTSALPSNAYLDNATLSLSKKDDYSTTDFDITIQNGQPTYPHNPMQSTNYNKNDYSGNGGTLNTSGFTNGYNAISLSNLSWINTTGTTKLCLRSSRDISGTTPTGSEYVNVYSNEFLGTGYQPKLVIVYRNQSKIKNLGSTTIKGYLLIQVQYFDDSQYPSTWIVDNDTINETTPRTINTEQQLALDLIFNGMIRASDLKHGEGTYRVYAAFRDPEGNILKTNTGAELKAWWQFSKT